MGDPVVATLERRGHAEEHDCFSDALAGEMARLSAADEVRFRRLAAFRARLESLETTEPLPLLPTGG